MTVVTVATRMSPEEVAEVVDWVVAAGAIYQVNGGWAVDALVTRETREHRDLDVFLDSTFVPPLLEWLHGRGYHLTEDWRPVRVELAGERGRDEARIYSAAATWISIARSASGAPQSSSEAGVATP